MGHTNVLFNFRQIATFRCLDLVLRIEVEHAVHEILQIALGVHDNNEVQSLYYQAGAEWGLVSWLRVVVLASKVDQDVRQVMFDWLSC